jgi:hypothetical protein
VKGWGTRLPSYNLSIFQFFTLGSFEVIVRFTVLFWLVLSLPLMAGLPSASQGSPVQRLEIPPLQKPGTEDEQRARMEKEMAKKANQARQAELKRDTEKLLKLATELKESVDKTNESTLSLDVVKKAEEIEKLAHSVKDKMKGN